MKLRSIAIAGAALCLQAGTAYTEELHIYSWTDYTSPELIKKFEAETGVKVTVDTYDSNETLLAKLQAGATGYDIVVPSQHFVEILIKQGLLQKVDAAALPNYKNVDPRWRNPAWDPTQEYTAPWHWGTSSFSYRSDLYKGKGESLKEFFEPSDEVKGRLQVLRSPDDIINMANLYVGNEFCSEDPQKMKLVQEVLMRQKPAVLTYASEGMSDRLASGETIMSGHWSGDSMKGRVEGNPNITYAYTKEGVVGWSDSLVIPASAQNVEAAKKFMDFTMDPQNIAIQSNFSKYANTIPASLPLLEDDMKDAPELTVPDGIQVKFGQACSEKAQKLIERIWVKLLQ